MSDKRLRRQLDRLFTDLRPVDKDAGASGASAPAPQPPATAAQPRDAGFAKLPGWTWESDAAGVYTICSPEVEAVLGYAPEEALGKSLVDFLPDGSDGAFEVDYGLRFDLREAFSRPLPIADLRLPICRKDGQKIMLVTHAVPIFDEAGAILGYRGVSHVAAPAAGPREQPPRLPAAAPLLEEPELSHGLTAGEWRAFLNGQGRRGLGYRDSADGLAPLGEFRTPEMMEAMERGELIFYDAQPAAAAPEAAPDQRAGRALAVPIQLQDQTIGVLDFFDEQGDHVWSEDDLALAQAVADQLALALDNARLFSATRDQLVKRTLLYDVTRSAASAASLTEALQSTVEVLGRMLPEADIAILLLDDDGRTLRLRASVGFPPELSQSLAIPVEQGVTGRVVRTNQPALVPDVRLDPDYLAPVSGRLSELAVPLALGDRVIGVINLESPRVNAFDEADLQLLSTLASTLSAIIVNNSLLDQISRERERLALLYDVLQRLTTTLDLDQLVDVLLAFSPRLGAQHGYVLMLGESEDEITFRGTVPGLEHLRGAEARAFAITIAQRGLERWVLNTHQPAVVPDTRLDERWYTDPAHVDEEPARAVISVPMRTQRGAVVGALAYTHPVPGALTEGHLPIVESIAGQAGVVLENARLYAQMRVQRRNAEDLARATQAMSGVLEETQLLQVLAEQLYASFDPECVVISRWERASNVLTPLTIRLGAEEGDLHHAYLSGESIRATQRLDLLAVIESRRGAIHLQEDPGDGRVRESMAMPLIYGGEAEGVVEVVRTSRGPGGGFAADDLQLFQSIMAALASALQSARLYAMQRETAERLAEVDRLKSQFLANMSHELRTPLNSIIGFSRVMLKGIDGPLSDLQSQDLTSIYSAGQHLLGLINDILDMSRIEAGKMELTLDEVDLHDVFKGVLSTASALVKDRPIVLQEDITPDLPSVRADSMRIRQVMLNLLANAAKFTEQGSITLRARPVEAPDTLFGQTAAFVEISVIDTGHGIAPHDMAKLFEPFSQVDASPARKAGGTGLGLNICRHLVELHGGRIWAESEEGRGSTFTFILPVNRPELQDTRTPTERASDAPVILVVDDDQGVLTLYRRYLEPHGYSVVGVTRSPEALARAEELQPFAILVDVLMPHKDGWQVLAELKQAPGTRALPVIICSIVADPERALELGAATSLVKPILQSDLLRALTRLPGRPTRPAPAAPDEDATSTDESAPELAPTRTP